MSLANIVLLALVVVLLFFTTFRPRRRSHPLPPGPTGLPLIGSLLEISKSRVQPDWRNYADWSRSYGNSDIVYFEVLGSGTVILNSYKAAIELLEKRSGNYSDRPDFYMLNQLLRWTWNFGFMRYSERWRLHRKIFHQFFQPRVIPEYYSIQRAASRMLIKDLLVSPKEFVHHIEHFASSIALEISYGYKLQKKNDPYVEMVQETSKGVEETVFPGSFLIEYLPGLKYIPQWLPGTSFKIKAEAWGKSSDNLVGRPWGWLKEARASGTAPSSFATQNLDKFQILLTGASEEVSGIEEVIRNCAAVTHQAGAHTTFTSIHSFILVMTLYPEIQQAAQEEIDRVVGRDRFPDFNDRENLPFVRAVLAETLRWNPVAPLGVSHRSIEDDVYEGYFIPGGSTVVGNIWAMTHDEELYGSNPMKFDPWRFMKSQEPPMPDPASIVFGFGRRICPGRHLAVNSLWIGMVHLLKTFTIAKDVDEFGNVIEVEGRYTTGTVSSPEPFKCRFIPRD